MSGAGIVGPAASTSAAPSVGVVVSASSGAVASSGVALSEGSAFPFILP